MTEIVEYEEPGTDLAVIPPATPTLFGTADPVEVVRAATAAAKPLADVVRKQNLQVRIGQSDHVRVEGWTLLGSMLGVFPICVWTRKIEGEDGGWEARVEARTRDGALVGAAEAECLRSERTWKGREDYALRSMAQTRATSKALRQPLGFVMQLAGFNPTPAEEMPSVSEREPKPAERPAVATGSEPGVHAPEPSRSDLITEAQKKKANILVGQLRDDFRLTTHEVYTAAGRLIPEIPEGESLHWSPLRDSLTKREASLLIDRLERYAKNDAKEPPVNEWGATDAVDALVEQLLKLTEADKKDATRAAIESNRQKHADDPVTHAAWLARQIERTRAKAGAA